MLSETPRSLMRFSAEPSFSGEASIIRWRTIERNTRRAIGTTAHGTTVAKVPPSLMSDRRSEGRNSGTIPVNARKFLAETRMDSGLITPSMKPTAKASPFGSRSKPANLLDATLAGIWLALETHSRTCLMLFETSSSTSVMVGMAVANFGTFTPQMVLILDTKTKPTPSKKCFLREV
jgi:hypothetical protein